MIIKNATLVTWGKPNRILFNYGIQINNGIIQKIAPESELIAEPGEETLDARGQIVMPGAICAHTHFYGVLSRGLAIPGAPAKDFPEILDKLWWPLDKSLSLDDVRVSAEICIVDAIKHGTTTLFDHHASQRAISGSLSEIAGVVDQSGVRASLCYEVTDRDGREATENGIEENLNIIERVRQGNTLNGRLTAAFGLHASLTLSDETLSECAKRIPRGYGFHIHTAEHFVDEDDSLAKCGKRVIDRLNSFGMLGADTIVVHGVHIDAGEMQLIRDTGTWITHQPRSNMNNAVGIARVSEMLRLGIPVCLGNDGFSNAMWEEWKTAYLVHKLWNRDPRWMNGYEVVDLAVYNNAQMASHFFGAKIGVLEEGACADLMFVDYDPITPMIPENLPWHILFGFRDSMVTGTMAAGKLLMWDRKLLTMDEKEIAQRARILAPETWKRFNQVHQEK